MLPRPPAFSPRFATPRHPTLWSGEGIGVATPVATPAGPVPAGQLRPGSEVLGPAGQVHVVAEARRVALPAAAHRRLGLAPPVEIGAGALGFGLPSTPIVAGPAQRLRLDGAWVAAGLLADGAGIRHLDAGAPVVLLRCEAGGTFLAAGMPVASAGAAPPARDGASPVPALLRLAGTAGRPQGFVDHADRFGAAGWALFPAAPERVVAVEAVADGTVLAQGLADRPRPDLVRAGTAGGVRHGFVLRFPRALSPSRSWLLTVRRAGGGPALDGSPLLIDAAAAAPERFDTALAGVSADPEGVRFLGRLIDAALRARRR